MGLVGQVDYKKGIWLQSLATPINEPYPICDVLSGQLGIPVYADNDVHCATLAELRFGAGLKVKDFVYINFGTGAAAGLVSEGRLIRGSRNYAGEIAHMTVNMDMDLMCACGRRGCVEHFASGGGMIRYARSLFDKYPDSALIKLDNIGKLFSVTIFAAAREGDPLAAHIKDLILRTYLAVFQDLISLMDPDAIVVGGGVFRDELLLPEIKKDLGVWLPKEQQNLLERIEPSSLDPQKVGLLGASVIPWLDIQRTN
jgi:glucokinase